jgi:predicted nucleic acid-binding protein
MLIVADTSPLNYLILVEAEGVLPRLYGRVLVPPQVRDELLHEKTPEPVRRWASALPQWLEVRMPASVEARPGLDEGEAAAIALAQEVRADRLLIDERAGRAVASRLGIAVAGTLAVLVDAADAKLLDLRPALQRLQQTTFRASPALIRETLRLHEQKKRP